MEPYDQPPRQPEQPAQNWPPGGQAQETPQMGAPGQAQPGAPQQPRVSELTPSTPTLLRLTIRQSDAQVPIGPDDRVLNSFYNAQIDAWEVLLVTLPREEEEEED